jgi:antirestriction protein ArdC
MISTISGGVKFQKGAGLSGYVAEIGSALLCADLGIVPELEPRPDHAAYLQSWLKVLDGDKRAIFAAAAHAQRAVTFLHGLQPQSGSMGEAA